MAQVLRHLEPFAHPNVLVGTDTLDDAGVYRLDDDLAIVQTVDFFPPLVDDPYDFGRIAAANALSDIYAMGAEPLAALNLVGYPDTQLDYDWLVEILRGGAAVVKEAGAVIIGGHSVRDAEIKYGLSVTGRVHPGRVWTNARARPGDRLVLTKPLGSGTLASAGKAGLITEDELREAIEVMAALNRPGCEAGLKVGLHACTDVTGFGLVGHAFEMAQASDVTIVLRAAEAPLMTGVLELARKGVLTRTHRTTAEFLGAELSVDQEVEPALAGVLMDAQTSGGLLMSVAAEHCDRLVREVEAAGGICAAVVGSVDDYRGVRVSVIP